MPVWLVVWFALGLAFNVWAFFASQGFRKAVLESLSDILEAEPLMSAVLVALVYVFGVALFIFLWPVYAGLGIYSGLIERFHDE